MNPKRRKLHDNSKRMRFIEIWSYLRAMGENVRINWYIKQIKNLVSYFFHSFPISPGDRFFFFFWLKFNLLNLWYFCVLKLGSDHNPNRACSRTTLFLWECFSSEWRNNKYVSCYKLRPNFARRSHQTTKRRFKSKEKSAWFCGNIKQHD